MDYISDLNNMRHFASVVDAGGFTAAANELGVQTSMLSRRVSQLETELGVRLLNRTTRHISLTEAGKTFYEHCVAVLAEAQSAQDAIRKTLAVPSGVVRFSCPIGLLQSGIADLLSEYLRKHPDVRISLEATNRRVDVVEEGFDFAIRVRTPPLENSELIMRSLGSSAMILVAAPALLTNKEIPEQLFDLKEMPTISMAVIGDKHVWRLRDDTGNEHELAHRPRLLTDDLHTLRLAALEGIGVAYLPYMIVAADLSNGALQRILPALSSEPGIVHAVFASRKGMVPAVRTLLDHLTEGFAWASFK